MWPTFEEYKESFEKWLKANHPNYLNEVEYQEWTNAFSVKHHSLVIIINYRYV
jgi:hypothetical protein